MFGELEPRLSMPREPEARLTLSQVRAVALPSRLKLLRALAERRATVSELSHRTGMPKSTALKHLRALERNGLVRREEDERLWRYYDLTRAGRAVGTLDPLRILVLASSSLAAAFGVSAAAVWERGRRTRASEEPWGVPPIGVDPLEPTAGDAAVLLGGIAAGFLTLTLALSMWGLARRRARREE